MTLISFNKCLLNTSFARNCSSRWGYSGEQDRQSPCPRGTYEQEDGLGERIMSFQISNSHGRSKAGQDYRVQGLLFLAARTVKSGFSKR